MNSSTIRSSFSRWGAALLCATLVAGCGSSDDGRDPVLGSGGNAVLRPTVTAVTPLAGATGVPLNSQVTATLSHAVNPLVLGTSFTLTCPAPCTAPTGSLVMDGAQRTGTFTLTPGTFFAPVTTYTATVTGAVASASGLSMQSPFTWQFTTGVRPAVTAVTPLQGSTGVAVANPVITAAFSEPMNPLTGAASFTVTCVLPCVSPTGTVSLDPTDQVATFAVTGALSPFTEYTATVTGATSIATGLSIVAPFTWTFTTVQRPAVTAVAPVNGVTGVPINNTIINAAFSQPMNPLTGAASFTVACALPCVSPTGTVSLDPTNRIATFVAAGTLTPQTQYTATVTGATSIATGLSIAAPFTWNFTTGIAPDTTRPRVTVTQPVTSTPGPTTGVATNAAITATFTEEMTPGTLVSPATTFGVTCIAPCVNPVGVVSYAVGSRTATFVPSAALAAGTTYTATITTTATDLSGNGLAGNQAPLPAASNYVWTFTTAAAIPPANVSVSSTLPLDNAVGVCPSATINATFDVPSGTRMDPLSVTAATFLVAGPGITPVLAASVQLDGPTGLIATFTPAADLIPGTLYQVGIEGGATGVKDLAVPANGMLADATWEFTAGPATGACLQPIPLNTASPYGVFGGSAGMTNTGTLTQIDGDIGTIATGTASITGFHDTGGDIYTETPANIGAVNGLIYTCTNSTTGPTNAGPDAVKCAAATQARLDAETAYLALAALPPGANPGANLAGLTLAPGVYTAPAGSFIIEGNDLTLDAQGDANAVFVFQMASSFRIGGPGAAAPQSIILTGGAQAKNVFWQVGSAATINAAGGGTFKGTVIAQAGVAVSTVGNVAIVTIDGRLLSLGASITVVNTVINVPLP